MELLFSKQGNTLRPIDFGSQIHCGSESTIYNHPTKSDLCFKVFHQPQRSEALSNKIAAMLNKRKMPKNISWPKEAVVDGSKKIVGYVMTKMSGKTLTSIFNPYTRKRDFPKWNRAHLCQLSLQILDLVDQLHQENVLIGDIQEQNIWIHNDQVFFLSTDSCQVDNFPSPMGSPTYLAPRLHGVNLQEILRTANDDIFAINVLLFKILMIGQEPYKDLDGNNQNSNLLNGNFPYVLNQNHHAAPPNGPWQALWFGMPLELRTLFYNTFKEHQTPILLTLAGGITVFANEIKDKIRSPSIDIDSFTKTMDTVELSTKIDDGRKRGFGRSETILRRTDTPSKLAVLELSTRACKLLIADLHILNHPCVDQQLNWTAFSNKSELTEMGTLLKADNTLPWNDFKKHVMPSIKKMLSIAENERVDRIYCIATAALRGATNRVEIVENIKETMFQEEGIELNIQILSRNEEGDATLIGYLWDAVDSGEGNLVLIDQGGGSTELSVYNEDAERLTFDGPTNIPIGTTSAINILLQQNIPLTNLEAALSDANKGTQPAVNKGTLPLQHVQFSQVIGVGTAITNATQKSSNEKQHGTILTLEQISDRQQKLKEQLQGEFITFGELYTFLQNPQVSKSKIKAVRNRLVEFMGLGMYLQILKRLNSQEIIVNGLGLRYGILREALLNIYPDFGKDPIANLSKYTVHGISEHTVVKGVVKNLNPNLGVFIELTSNITGLAHKSTFQKYDRYAETLLNVYDTVNVYVHKITKDHNGQYKFELSLWDPCGKRV